MDIYNKRYLLINTYIMKDPLNILYRKLLSNLVKDLDKQQLH